eukprot:3856862-Pleurochrysis_carterae.AAC.2
MLRSLYVRLQVGVVAWGQGCDDPLYPGAYTRIGSFNQWIEARTVDTLSSPPSPLPSPPPPMWPVRSPPPPSYTQAEACRQVHPLRSNVSNANCARDDPAAFFFSFLHTFDHGTA